MNLRVPKIVDCEAAIAKFPQRKKLPLFEGKFDASFPPQPIDINYIIHLATTLKLDLPDELVKSFVSDLKVNEGKFSTHYTGDSEWAQDHSEDCIEHEEQILAQLQKDIDLGRIIGPFPSHLFQTNVFLSNPGSIVYFRSQKTNTTLLTLLDA